MISFEQQIMEGFRSIFEHAAAGMAMALVDGSLLQVNPAFCQFLGYTEAGLMNLSVHDITHPADLDRTRAMFLEAEEGKRSAHHYQKRYLCKDGSTVWGLTTVAWVSDAAGRPAYCVALIQDITAQKEAERALRESEELYRTLVENIDLGINLIGDDRRILKVNAASSRMLAKPVEEITGQEGFLESLPDCDRGQSKKLGRLMRHSSS